MADVDQPGGCLGGDHIEHGEDEVPVVVVEADAGFVEDEDRRLLHHRPGEQHEPLLAEGDLVVMALGEMRHAEGFEPSDGVVALAGAAVVVEPD